MELDQHELHRRCRDLTDRTNTGFGLLRLSDSEELTLEDRTQDIRGLEVYDTNGEEIGTVEGLYIDEEARNCALRRSWCATRQRWWLEKLH